MSVDNNTQPPAPSGPQYGLKASESNLLAYVRNNQNAMFSAILAHVARDRLAYHVTNNTQFVLSDDFTKLEIRELPPEDGQKPASPSGIHVSE